MANIAILASGNGSNFEAITKALDPQHEVVALICNRKKAFAFERAKKLGIPSHYVTYKDRERVEVESEIHQILLERSVDLVVLAGFMKVFTTFFVAKWQDRLVNIHPSLLPKYPGTQGILEGFQSNDKELGITIHFVNEGVDTGEFILQKSFQRTGAEKLEEIEERVHALEHKWYPVVINQLLQRTK